MKPFSVMIGFFAWILIAGCTSSTEEIPAVRDFKLDRYMGTWYEIARLPHVFERELDFVRAEYSLRPDGTVRVVNRGMRRGKSREITGRAKWKNPRANPPAGELRVSFFGPFYSDYRIIELPPDYSYAVVTGSGRNFLWVLSRTPTFSPERLRPVLERLGRLGFEIEKLEYPRQTPD